MECRFSFSTVKFGKVEGCNSLVFEAFPFVFIPKSLVLLWRSFPKHTKTIRVGVNQESFGVSLRNDFLLGSSHEEFKFSQHKDDILCNFHSKSPTISAIYQSLQKT